MTMPENIWPYLLGWFAFQMLMLCIGCIGSSTLNTPELRLHGTMPWWSLLSLSLMLLGMALPLLAMGLGAGYFAFLAFISMVTGSR